jgi:hypothetical protein
MMKKEDVKEVKKLNIEEKQLTNKELVQIAGGIKGTPGGNGSTYDPSKKDK